MINIMERFCWNGLCTLAVFLLLVGGGMSAAFAASINIYSHRQQALNQPFLDAFTAKTGVETKVVQAVKGLAQRLQAEGEAGPADAILTGDIARLAGLAPQAQMIIDRVGW